MPCVHGHLVSFSFQFGERFNFEIRKGHFTGVFAPKDTQKILEISLEFKVFGEGSENY